MFPTLLVIFGTVFNIVFSEPGNIIPSKQEQSNLLKNVEEIFNEIKVMVSDEGGATDSAVIVDVQKLVEKALDQLSLYEELATLKISCTPKDNDSMPLSKLKLRIDEIIRETEDQLQGCTNKAAEDINNNSNLVTTTIKDAMNSGQVLLDTLNRCSKKVGMNQISCYKKIITTDVHPLKLILIDAVKKHKVGHLEAISIRNRANECVDNVLENCRKRIVQFVNDSVR